jgi:hypothetical protein
MGATFGRQSERSARFHALQVRQGPVKNSVGFEYDQFAMFLVRRRRCDRA